MALHKTRSSCVTILLLLTVSAGGGGGCVTASLASNTGPRPAGRVWSMAGRQMAHVGEEVKFDFVLTDWAGRWLDPLGIGDYAAAYIGGERIEATPDVNGHFQFGYTLDQVGPGDRIKVKATAFRQRGGRDFMKIRGQWLQSDSPYEEPDQAIASDAIQLAVYQVPIELTLVRPADDLDPENGVLRLRRMNGLTTSVFIDRPGRPGFTITGPEPDGYYRISYQPTGNELNPVGTTEVEFTIYDTLGQPHYAHATLKTP